MKEYRYVCFEELPIPAKTKTKRFMVKNKIYGDMLGHIKWYGAWRQYCFFVNYDIVFCSECLADIADFINNLMAERKAQKGDGK